MQRLSPSLGGIRSAALRSVPAGVLAGAALDINFKSNSGYANGVTGQAKDFLTVSRSSSGDYVQNSAGVWVPVAANTLRRSDLGMRRGVSRVNSYLHSFDLSNASWSVNGFTRSADGTLSPDNSSPAAKVVSTAAGAYIYQSVAVTSGTTYTVSVFVKPAGRTAFVLLAQGALFADATTRTASFTLTGDGSTAIISGTSVSSAIKAYPNGWYRISLTFTPTLSVTNTVQLRDSVTGDSVNGFYLAMAQWEVGPYATSPMSSEGSPVTRALDVITADDVASWWPVGDVSIYFEGTMIGLENTNNWLFSADDGTFNDEMRLLVGATGTITLGVTTGGVGQASVASGAGAITAGSQFKALAVYGVNDFRLYLNGALASTPDTSGTIPTGIANFRLGQRVGNVYPSSHIAERVAVFPGAMEESRVLELTTL